MGNFTFRHSRCQFKTSQTTFCPFYNQIDPRTENSLFQNICSKAMGLLSRRSNFVSKRKGNQKLTANNFGVRLTSSKEEIPRRKDPICYTKQKLTTKQKAFVLYTLCPTSLLPYETFFYPLLINKLLFHHLLFKPPFVPPVYCSTHLLLKPSFVLFFHCSVTLLF